MEKEINDILSIFWNGYDNIKAHEARNKIKMLVIKEKLQLLKEFEGNSSEIADEVYFKILDLEKEIKNYE